MFVKLPGLSVHEAFVVGERIAKIVTNRNPRPIQLQMEKVYRPCVLIAKKRCVCVEQWGSYATAGERDEKR